MTYTWKVRYTSGKITYTIFIAGEEYIDMEDVVACIKERGTEPDLDKTIYVRRER